MLTEKQKKEIRECAVEGRLSCAQAFQLSEEFKVSLKEIGRFCDDEGIKIKNCRLGCF